MDRRHFIQSLGVTGLFMGAGCSVLGGPTDSDGDGVPDKVDYAPRDGEITKKQDVIDEFLVRPTPPSNDSFPTVVGETENFTNREFDTQIATLQISENSVQAEIPITDQPDREFRLLFIVREFPDGKILNYNTSEALQPDTQISKTYSVEKYDSSILFCSIYTIPNAPLNSVPIESVQYLRETDPFVQTDTGGMRATTSKGDVRDVDGKHFSRTKLSGGYNISITGTTENTDWAVSYLVSQSSYISLRGASRGRSREEHLKYVLARDLAKSFSNIILTEGIENGFREPTEQVEFAVDLIQSFPYISDKISTGFDDYTKYPQETIVDISGDCEDTTILLAAVLAELGYEIALIEFPNHIGVGVAGRFEGDYLTGDGTRYYYIETTSPGWGIGELPSVLNPESATFSLF